MYPEEEWIALSAVQQYAYCARRAALIHFEQLWQGNRFTAEGMRVHKKAHDSTRSETRSGTRIVRGLEIKSAVLGLSGKCDVVEFYKNGKRRKIRIVEYKRGKPKGELDKPFQVQLCAQAMCLEEMMDVAIPYGYIFFAKIRRRDKVVFDDSLRKKVIEIAEKLHELARTRRTPPPEFGAKCRNCSLHDLCLPKIGRIRKTAARYLRDIIKAQE
ncbi:CRISPR-associated protein Cas4 [Thermostilla marina]